MKRKIKKWIADFFTLLIPDLYYLEKAKKNFGGTFTNSVKSEKVKLHTPFIISDSTIGDYTYISDSARISFTDIGKFCSIGPNFSCGRGIHPLDGISTSPMFYSTLKQNGYSLSKTDKIIERKKITIGHDVFIGMNVTILDGVSIGHGAVIGAGCVVAKDVPPYAIVVGNPMKIIRYRFSEEKIQQLLSIQWWNFEDKRLTEIEKDFFDIESFIEKNRIV